MQGLLCVIVIKFVVKTCLLLTKFVENNQKSTMITVLLLICMTIIGSILVINNRNVT